MSLNVREHSPIYMANPRLLLPTSLSLMHLRPRHETNQLPWNDTASALTYREILLLPRTDGRVARHAICGRVSRSTPRMKLHTSPLSTHDRRHREPAVRGGPELAHRTSRNSLPRLLAQPAGPDRILRPHDPVQALRRTFRGRALPVARKPERTRRALARNRHARTRDQAGREAGTFLEADRGSRPDFLPPASEPAWAPTRRRRSPSCVRNWTVEKPSTRLRWSSREAASERILALEKIEADLRYSVGKRRNPRRAVASRE